MRAIRDNLRIARNLRLLRERAGLTQRELATAVGRDVRTIRGYEDARHAIRLRAAGDIVDALGSDLGELARGPSVTAGEVPLIPHDP